MQTTHRIVHGDARSLDDLASESVELVVTSPPYPMIEMWDEQFGTLDPEVTRALEGGDGEVAFERMHGILDAVWDEVARVLVDGGIACINIGDATRTVGDAFRVYQNHARVIEAFEARGFDPLPEILWRKPTNAVTKFMGSGMLPPNAYVTLEHEYVLVFRNGSTSRQFAPGAQRRYESAYFWEERNRWFSDVWTDLTGIGQELDEQALRDRSAAYPFALPYRLVNMYSVRDDTVLDPFWGTGTTSVAALVGARNSIGVELESEFRRVFRERLQELPTFSRRVIERRLRDHLQFVAERETDGEDLGYESAHYEVPVTTKQERQIRFYGVDDVRHPDADAEPIRATHRPIEPTELDVDLAEPRADE